MGLMEFFEDVEIKEGDKRAVLAFGGSLRDHYVFTPLTVMNTMANMNMDIHVDGMSKRSWKKQKYVEDFNQLMKDTKKLMPVKKDPVPNPEEVDVVIMPCHGMTFWFGTPKMLKDRYPNAKIIAWNADPDAFSFDSKKFDYVISFHGRIGLWEELGIQLPGYWKDLEVEYKNRPENELFVPFIVDPDVFVPLEKWKDYILIQRAFDPDLPEDKRPAERKLEFIDAIIDAQLNGKKHIKKTFYGDNWDKNPRWWPPRNHWEYGGACHWREIPQIIGESSSILQTVREIKKTTAKCIYTERIVNAFASESLLISDQMTMIDEKLGLVDGKTFVELSTNMDARAIAEKVNNVSNRQYNDIKRNARNLAIQNYNMQDWAKCLDQFIQAIL